MEFLYKYPPINLLLATSPHSIPFDDLLGCLRRHNDVVFRRKQLDGMIRLYLPPKDGHVMIEKRVEVFIQYYDMWEAKFIPKN